MNIALLLGVALAFLSGTSASAGEWRTVAAYADGVLAVDVASVSRSGGQVTAWTVLGAVNHPGMRRRGIEYIVSRESFDCAGERYRTLAWVAYGVDGQTVSTVELPSEWSVVWPDTMVRAAFEALCNDEWGTEVVWPGTASEVAEVLNQNVRELLAERDD